MKKYTAQSAIDSSKSGYGDESYWDYLEQSAIEHRDYFLRKGDKKTAEEMMTRNLGQCFIGNDGD